MKSRKRRPGLRLELGALGLVDPFRLEVVEDPPGSERLAVQAPGAPGVRLPLETAGLNLVGAGQALLGLSFRWMTLAGGGHGPEGLGPTGEVRLLVRRREARLLAALLRRHLGRLPQPARWMADFLKALEEVDLVLRWEEEP